ncbi:MAG TPA: VWA domain-containing protein [Polyangia bacterium]
MAALLLVSGLACTDTGLEPPLNPGTVYDNELHLSAEVCLTPASDAAFPVKILFVVDNSDSMNVTDPGGMRGTALSTVIAHYSAQPGVTFGIIVFESKITRVTDGFVTGPIGLNLAKADRLTDYQGALSAAYQMISEDIVASSAAERARSKYVVIFFSDGTPDPQCSAQVTVCGAATCPAHQHCRAGVCKDDYLICSVPRKDWQDAFSPPLSPDLYPDLGQGADYNQMSQILRSVDDILGLQDFYRVGEIRLHTAFLYDPSAASSALAAPFGLDHAGGVELMTAMAEHGFGTFTEFSSASNIDFLNMNYTSFKEENGLAMMLATNLNVVDTGAGLKPDTDGDGLIDENETGITCVGNSASCPDPMDSDGDGYTDLFEERNRVSGFDPNDAKKPLTPCASKSDLDGDLLRDCEEAFLRTDPRNPDSDGDRIPDGVEFRLGMDPLNPDDIYDDPDRDGERSIDEVKAHTNPLVATSPSHPVVRYLYDIAPFTKAAGEQCFQLDVRHIKLLTTGKGTDSRLGLNRVLLYFDEAPVDRALDFGRMRVACVDVRYVDGALKSPSDGLVSFSETDFKPAATFDQRKDCLDRASIPMPSKDAGSP